MIGWMSVGLLAGAAAADPAGDTVAQMTIRSRMVVRIQTAIAAPPPVRLVEKKGPGCVPMADVSAAAVIEDGGVDFILRGGRRLRARFSSSCPALDYYSGFYVVPTADGMICADRDAIRSRAGGECAIDRFRLLEPKKRR